MPTALARAPTPSGAVCCCCYEDVVRSKGPRWCCGGLSLVGARQARILAGVSPQTTNQSSASIWSTTAVGGMPWWWIPIAQPVDAPLSLAVKSRCSLARFASTTTEVIAMSQPRDVGISGLISPITGIVTELRSIPSSLASAHVVVAGHNPAQGLEVESLNDLRRNLRSSAAGKGASLEQDKGHVGRSAGALLRRRSPWCSA